MPDDTINLLTLKPSDIINGLESELCGVRNALEKVEADRDRWMKLADEYLEAKSSAVLLLAEEHAKECRKFEARVKELETTIRVFLYAVDKPSDSPKYSCEILDVQPLRDVIEKGLYGT